MKTTFCIQIQDRLTKAKRQIRPQGPLGVKGKLATYATVITECYFVYILQQKIVIAQESGIGECSNEEDIHVFDRG